MTEEVEKVPEEEKSPDARAKRLTSEQWARCEALYGVGVRNKELVAEFGVTEQAIGAHMRKIGLIKGSKRELLNPSRLGQPAAPPKPAGPVSDFEAKRKERIEIAKERARGQSSFVDSQTMK